MMRVLNWFVLVISLGFGAAFANNIGVDSIEIENAWSRQTVAGMQNGVAYFTVHNNGSEADRIVAVDSPVSEVAELHTHIKDGEVMRMRQVEYIDVPANGSVNLEPGGLHVMLMGLKNPLKAGEVIPVTLKFEQAGSITIEVAVRPLGKAKNNTDEHAGH